MTAEDAGSVAIGRIVAVLQAPAVSPTVLESVVDLAARLDARLEALITLDANLLTLAELPFALQVVPHHPAARPLRRSELELEFKAVVGGARRRLEALAARHGVPWTLRPLHARAVEDLVAAAADADLLVLAGSARLAGRAIRPDAALPRLIASISRPILLVPPGRRGGGPVYVVAGPAGEPGIEDHALKTARLLARRYASPLTVLGTPVGTGPDPLRALLEMVGAGTLVLPAPSGWLQAPGVVERLARAAATIVLTR